MRDEQQLPAAQTRLEQLEAIIHQGKAAFYAVGCALREIRDERLYKLKHGGAYATFEAYCTAVWGWQRRQAYRQIDAAQVVESLCPNGHKIEELTEGLVRPLTKLPTPEAQRQCFQAAQELASQEGRPITARHVAAIVRDHCGAAEPWLIKPSDNWNFSQVFYARIDGEARHGYIPGELYANCLWYYTKPGDVVLDGMAGSGQIFRVYDDRTRWMRPEPWDLDIVATDLTPRGPYAERIQACDIRHGFPVPHAHYIFLDIPYYGMVQGVYSASPADVGNMEWPVWQAAMTDIALACARIQKPAAACTVVSPNFRDTTTGRIVLAPRLIERVFEAAGYYLCDIAYSSRRIQQAQTPDMARMNTIARARRVMLTDIAEVLTFRRQEDSMYVNP